MPTEKDRPWYLAVALLFAISFGITGGCAGMQRMAEYHAQATQLVPNLDPIQNDADRERITRAFDDTLMTRDRGKGKAYPLSIAAFLIGTALAWFTLRTMGGKREARPLVVQLVAAQSALALLTFVWTKDIRVAESELDGAVTTSLGASAWQVSMYRAAAPIQLAFRTFLSAAIVIALTRPRVRRLFEGEPSALPEQLEP